MKFLVSSVQDIAEQLETTTEITRPIQMSKMRSRLMIVLIFYNAKTVQKCYKLFSVENNIDELLTDENDLDLN